MQQVIAATPGRADSIPRAVKALGGRGGIVYLPSGQYTLAETVYLPSSTAIVGAGPGATKISLAPGANCHMFTNADHGEGNEHIELRDLALEGNMWSQHRPPEMKALTFACGGIFRRVEHLRVQNIHAHGLRQTAFHFNRCSDIDVVGLEADEMGWSGVSTSEADDIRLRAVVVTNAGLDVRHSGIHLDGGVGAVIEAVVERCTGNGIMLDSKFSPLSNVYIRSTARHSLRGLSLSGAHENPLTNVCVVGGDYSDNSECGILLSNSSHIFIVDATIASNQQAGIVLQGKIGVAHAVAIRCRITGSPTAIEERDGSRLGYQASTTSIAGLQEVEPLAQAEPVPPAPAASPPPATRAAAPADAATPADPPLHPLYYDSYEGVCNICGQPQEFVRLSPYLREGYRCASCRASLRYRGQADVIVRSFARGGAVSIADIVREPEFAELAIWEPGVLGPLRQYFRSLPHYVMSDFWPDVAPGDSRDGVRCEDLMAVTFAAESFDLVVTSDIFEHVRRPYVGFAEVHRVLRPGGAHIFSIPVQEPMPKRTVERVDTAGDDDVMLLEPRYHLGPGNSQHIVYNDFGRDMLDRLTEVGFETEAIRYESSSTEASRLLTFRSVKKP